METKTLKSPLGFSNDISGRLRHQTLALRISKRFAAAGYGVATGYNHAADNADAGDADRNDGRRRSSFISHKTAIDLRVAVPKAPCAPIVYT